MSVYLDNVVFQLCSNGFFGGASKRAAKAVNETKFRPSDNAIRIPFLQIGLLMLSFVVMLAGLAAVLVAQLNGQFLPQHIIVQFDDKIRSDLGTYSGLYALKVNEGRFDHSRVVYESQRDNEGSIGFCGNLYAWTFGVGRYDHNFCEGIMAMSNHPTSADISESLGDIWYVRTDNNRALPMENVYSGAGCQEDFDCGSEERGECVRNRCECRPRFFGLKCNYAEAEVCETLRTNEQTNEFVELQRPASFEYKVLRDSNGTLVTVYEHPVYVDAKNVTKRLVDVILYTGIRWILTSVPFPSGGDDGLASIFNPSFHASSNTLDSIEAATEVVRFDSASDENSNPTNLQWFLPGSPEIADMDPVISISAVLLCSKCDDDLNPCAFNNICGENGNCVCGHGEGGSLCQITPSGDGKCDRFFNKQE